MDIDIGLSKSGRRAYGFDDISIVPSRRTRDPDDVDISWEIDAFRFRLPMLGSAMDSAVSPATAVAIGRLGGLGVLNLEGLWSRYEDPDPVFEEIAALPAEKATRRMQELYRAPIIPDLMRRRMGEMKASGVVTAGALTPQSVESYIDVVLGSRLDLLVIQGTVVSAEHMSTRSDPLDLNSFIAGLDMPVIVGGCASYAGAIHLMRTGAAGILVGVGPGAACTTRGRARSGRSAGDRDRRRGRSEDPVPRRDRSIRPRDRRRGYAHRGGHRQGDCLWGRLRDDRLPAGLGGRSSRARGSLGYGHLPSHPPLAAPG